MNSSFCENLYKELNDKLIDFNNFQKKMLKEQIIDEDISQQITQAFEKMKEEEDLKDLKKFDNYIKKILSFCVKNIQELKVLKESNINNFKERLSLLINNCNKDKQEELKKKVDYTISTLDMFFKSDYEDKKKDSNEINNFKSSIDKIKSSLINLINDNKREIAEFKKVYREKIKESLTKKKENIEEQLKKQNYKVILEEINKEMILNLKDLDNNIKGYLNKNEIESSNNYNETKKYIENFAKGKSNCLKLDCKLKDYISRNIGDIENNLEKEIFEEIENSCESSMNILYKKGFKDWFYSLFSSQYYLENIIDMIIETFLGKIDPIFVMLLEYTNAYLDDLKRIIEKTELYLTLQFNDEQLKIWNELKKLYEETRQKIIEIK